MDNKQDEAPQAPKEQQQQQQQQTNTRLLAQDLEANCRKLIQEQIQEWKNDRPKQAQEELQKLLREAEDDLDTSANSTTSLSNTSNANTTNSNRKELLVQLRRTLRKLEAQENEGKEQLPQDTFSFFLVASSPKPFLYAMIPLVIQVAISILMLLDTLEAAEKDYNPFNLPVDVDLPVRLSQLVALLVTVVTQDDILIALTQLADGYDAISNLSISFPKATKAKWFFSLFCRLGVGFLVLFVSFLLIVQQENVVDVFLNFLAASFISEMDNIAFRLALNNFASKKAQEVAAEIQTTSVVFVKPLQNSSNNSSCILWWNSELRRRLLILILSIPVLAAWVWVVQQQSSGNLLTRTILVQFDDNFSPSLGTFSGLYTLRKGAGRAKYVEKRYGQSIFAYCDEAAAWSFVIDDDATTDIDSLDPCQGLAQSSQTATYDITKTSESSWFTMDEDRGALPMQHFYIASYDCRDDGICGNHGQCSGDGCLCDEGWFGLRCEFPSPCLSIERDERRDGFLGSRLWSQQFEVLQHDDDGTIAAVYSRPVYVKLSAADEVYDVILFTGRRWMMTHTGRMTDFLQGRASSSAASTIPSLRQLSDYLVKDFHAYWSNYTVAFVSEPVDIGTPGDSATPISLQWFGTTVSATEQTSVAVADERQNQQVTLICQLCNNQTNPCFFGSICQSNGVCDCTTRATGILCQVPPMSNGRCDEFFNNPSFQYDGGDCCLSTCENTGENICGFDTSGSGLVGYHGFDRCRDPSQICTNCWKALIPVPLTSDATEGDFHSFWFSYYMALSRNGKVLAVHDGLRSRGFQVYAIQSSKLVEKGNLLAIPDVENVEGFYGDSVSLSDDGNTVAIGGSDMVQVYRWDPIGWLPAGQKLIRNEPDLQYDPGMSVKLSSDGFTLAVGYISPGAVVVYDRMTNAACEEGQCEGTYFVQWVARDENGIVSTDGQTWYAISLSGDGNTIAVGVRADITARNREAVRVFRWRDGSWNQVGSDIKLDDAAFAGFGKTIALSFDASIVAVGSPSESTDSVSSGAVRVFEWDGSHWARKGAPIFGRSASLGFGSSLSLSNNGLILAVACNSEKSTSCEMATMSWNEGTEEWVSLGGEDPISVGSGSVGVLSGDGSILAVASINKNQVDVIETNVFKFQSPPLQCKTGESLLRLSLLPDNEGGETKWSLIEEAGNITLVDEGGFPDDALPVFRELCFKTTSCLSLELYDDGGDGMCCDKGQGSYIVWVDGVEVASGGDFNWYDEVRIGNCPSKCSNETSLFRLELKLDKYGSESSWELWNETWGLTADPGGIYPDDETAIDVREVCVPKDECYTFVFKELCDDDNYLSAIFGSVNPDCGLGFEDGHSGYSISLDGEEIGNSQGFRLSRNHSIGTCIPSCENGLSLLRFMLRTDRRGSDTTWSISSDNGEVQREGGPYELLLYTSVVEEVCIDTVNSCTTVAVYDSSGDGIFTEYYGVGGFFIEVDGVEIKFGGIFESSDITRIGNCRPTSSPSHHPTGEPSQQPSMQTANPTLSASPSISSAPTLNLTGLQNETSSSPQCQNAVEVFPDNTIGGETTSGSFDDFGIGECGTPITSPGAWYKMQGTGEIITVSTCYAADFDTKISIFKGTCDSLECIVGDDDSLFCASYTSVAFVSDSDSTYYILIHGYETETGSFNMTVSGGFF